MTGRDWTIIVNLENTLDVEHVRQLLIRTLKHAGEQARTTTVATHNYRANTQPPPRTPAQAVTGRHQLQPPEHSFDERVRNPHRRRK